MSDDSISTPQDEEPEPEQLGLFDEAEASASPRPAARPPKAAQERARQAELHKAISDAAESQARLEEMRTAYEGLKTRSEAAERSNRLRIENLEKSLESSQRLLEETKRRLDRQEDDARQVRHQSSRSEQAMAAQLEKVRTELRETLRELNEARRKLQLRDEEMRASQQQHVQKEQALNRQINELRQRPGGGQIAPEEVERKWRTQLERQQKLAREKEHGYLDRIGKLEAELQRAKDHLEHARTDHADAERDRDKRLDVLVEQLDGLRSETLDLSTRLEERQAELARSRQTVETLRRNLEEESRRRAEELDLVRTEVAEKLKAYEVLKAEAAEKEDIIRGLQGADGQAKAGLQQRVTELEKELEESRACIAELSQDLENKREEYRLLGEQTKARERELLVVLEDLRGRPFTQEKPLE